MAPNPLLLITGASRGIGAGIAAEAAKRGYDLIVAGYSDRTALDKVAASLRTEGVEVISHCCDLAEQDQVAALFAKVRDLNRPLAGLINNAAYAGERTILATARIDEIDRILNVNVRGTLLMCQAAIPLMPPGSCIVNLSSQSAQFGGHGLAAYAASKAAINGLTISLAREVAACGIRVVAVSPGPVMTESLQALPAQRLAEMAASLPMGRFCSIADIARTVLWLLSPDAGYISGAIVPVHGAR